MKPDLAWIIFTLTRFATACVYIAVFLCEVCAGLDDLVSISECVGGRGLAAICKLLSQDFSGWAGLFPIYSPDYICQSKHSLSTQCNRHEVHCIATSSTLYLDCVECIWFAIRA